MGAPRSHCPVVVSGVGVTLPRPPSSAPPRLPQVGEDVPDARKCACASHVAKIAEFFQVGDTGAGDNVARAPTPVPDGCLPPTQGVDVIVNASSVEDIDPGAIGQRLSNGLARVSSPVLHRLRLREDENAEPVVMSPWQRRWRWRRAQGIPPAWGSCLPQPVTPCAAYCYSPSLIPAPPPPPPLLRPRAPLTRKLMPPWR